MLCLQGQQLHILSFKIGKKAPIYKDFLPEHFRRILFPLVFSQCFHTFMVSKLLTCISLLQKKKLRLSQFWQRETIYSCDKKVNSFFFLVLHLYTLRQKFSIIIYLKRRNHIWFKLTPVNKHVDAISSV